MRQVVMFKHGVAYYGLEGVVVDSGVLKLTFKLGELDDVLKSLAAADMSGQGYISAVTYDAAEDETKLFESAAIRVSERNSFSGTLSQLPGAEVELDVGGRTVSGLIVGLEVAISRLDQNSVQTPSLVVFNREAGSIEKIAFTDLRGFKLQSEELGKELQFYLNAALSAKKKGSRTVSIACEGKGARDLAVSYVTESPIWKTSYRILLPKVSEESESGAESEEPADSESNLKILLSGWCLVENTTDQDWDRVELSLVAGMPVSFKMPLFKPLYIERPHVQPARTTGATVMDIDDEVDRVSYNEATIAAPCLAPPCEPEERAKSEGLGNLGASASGAGMGAGDMARMFKMANADSFGVMEKQTVSKDAFRAQMAQATAVESKDFGETFEYKISNPVSIKRQQSALVPIVNADVEGRKILVYNPVKNNQNPMACIELTNTTGLTLEKGPVTILYEDTLAGEAMFPFLNQGETRIISYAVEQGVVILYEDVFSTHDIHRIRFISGTAYEYYYYDRNREYKINNKTNGKKVLILDHPRTAGYDLLNEEPHKETPGAWRFELKLPPKQGVKFTVQERQESSYMFSLWNVDSVYLRDKLVKYSEQKFISSELEQQLTDIAQLNEELRSIQNQISDLEAQLRRIDSDQNRLRENLKALKKGKSELRLRQTYITKFSEQEDEYESTIAQLKELRAKANELNVQIKKMIDEIIL